MKVDRTRFPVGFLDRLNNAVKNSGLTTKELCKATGKTRSTIYAYRCGDTAPDVATFSKLCRCLKVSSDYLLYGERK